MIESILNTIKAMLGIPITTTSFDQELIVHINSAFMVLNQLGLGTQGVYSITGVSEEWSAFLIDPDAYSSVKTYIYLSVKLAFDPPQSSFVLESLNRQREELGWRLNAQVPIPPEPSEDEDL